MKIRYRLANADVEVDGKDVKDAFAQLGGAVEVFSNNTCGACKCPDVVPSVREVQGNTYYEMRCTSCGATLSFGQKKADGSLFPKRRDKDGNYLEHYGWVKFQKQQRVDEQPF